MTVVLPFFASWWVLILLCSTFFWLTKLLRVHHKLWLGTSIWNVPKVSCGDICYPSPGMWYIAMKVSRELWRTESVNKEVPYDRPKGSPVLWQGSKPELSKHDVLLGGNIVPWTDVGEFSKFVRFCLFYSIYFRSRYSTCTTRLNLLIRL